MAFSNILFASTDWVLYDDFNSSAIDSSKWTSEFDGYCVAPVIVNDSAFFACPDERNDYSESELVITDANITGIQADLAFSSFNGIAFSEVFVTLVDDEGKHPYL